MEAPAAALDSCADTPVFDEYVWQNLAANGSCFILLLLKIILFSDGSFSNTFSEKEDKRMSHNEPTIFLLLIVVCAYRKWLVLSNSASRT